LNPHDFEAGSRVMIELPDGSFIKAVFLVYMLPIIGGALVAWIGDFFGKGISDGYICILFMTGVAIVFALLRTYDNRAIFRNSYLPVIVRGAEEDEE
jgi:positive regulator of sigma E activity